MLTIDNISVPYVQVFMIDMKYTCLFCFVQSVSLWCDYIKFVQDYDPFVREGSPTGISKLRNLFERALTAAGLHITEGFKIWEAYRKFELALLDNMDKTDIEVSNISIESFNRQPIGYTCFV